MKKMLPVVAVAAVILGYLGYNQFQANKPLTAEQKQTQTDLATLPVENKESQSLVTKAVESGKYALFSSAEAAALEEADEPHVIFFHANWCSWCRKREQEILGSLDEMPANTRILKANYDKEAALKQQYGVVKQDAYVFIDSKGNATLKDGASVETINQFFTDETVTPGEERPQGLGGYFDYDPEVVETFKGQKAYAFFFHASWCPPCRALDKDIRENLSTLPKNTNIFKVDYDANTELRQKLGVTRQDTFVWFDKDGNVMSVQSGVDLDDITQYFQ